MPTTLPHPSLPLSLEPTSFGFVYVSFTYLPWWLFPSFPPFFLFSLPSGHCQFVLYFNVSGYLFACLFCWLGSYFWKLHQLIQGKRYFYQVSEENCDWYLPILVIPIYNCSQWQTDGVFCIDSLALQKNTVKREAFLFAGCHKLHLEGGIEIWREIKPRKTQKIEWECAAELIVVFCRCRDNILYF